jgi:hypothetical protein
MRDILLQMFIGVQPVTGAARSKTSVCGRSRAGILVSNPAGGRDVFCCEYRVLSGRGVCDGLITRPGVLPTVVLRCVRSRKLKYEEVMARFGPHRHKK